ncbi:hypothetical protein [Streptomyces sp. NPDC057582]|uniref:hypothetical protein n=1 Tax=Streptomyces sp. NPDC057582 TaxID=3346174 RepID=UPI0036B3441C
MTLTGQAATVTGASTGPDTVITPAPAVRAAVHDASPKGAVDQAGARIAQTDGTATAVGADGGDDRDAPNPLDETNRASGPDILVKQLRIRVRRQHRGRLPPRIRHRCAGPHPGHPCRGRAPQ